MCPYDTSDSKYDSGDYGFIKYTLGTSKFAWHGGQRSDYTIRMRVQGS